MLGLCPDSSRNLFLTIFAMPCRRIYSINWFIHGKREPEEIKGFQKQLHLNKNLISLFHACKHSNFAQELLCRWELWGNQAWSQNATLPPSSLTSLPLSSFSTGEDDDDEECGEEKLPSCFDYVMHFLTVFWKVLFAFVPPTEYWNGWACFVVSICMIGLLTAVIGMMTADKTNLKL